MRDSGGLSGFRASLCEGAAEDDFEEGCPGLVSAILAGAGCSTRVVYCGSKQIGQVVSLFPRGLSFASHSQ
jgi:hypothetical protein